MVYNNFVSWFNKILRILIIFMIIPLQAETNTNKNSTNDRIGWWRDARFGLFIHWGLYSIPAGEWGNNTEHGEWIRTTAQIPLEEYNRFVPQFNPTQFNAEDWVLMAKKSGMKYIVITSKHHDGFCLFDSKYTEYDIMSTPYKRDILNEIAEACRKHDMKMCWYYSIMDWHHPDYIPRRDWEISRTVEGSNYDLYFDYMKNQIKELVNNYGDIGVLWFDGEWEGTWTHEHGKEIYNYIRGLDSNIIINNRVDVGRTGLQGLTRSGDYVGDFGTPEQEIPPTGIKGVDWETCMTMNNHWGYNKNDKNWKTVSELIQNLVDICSKGGNFLLNIGPMSSGLFPTESIEILEGIGSWMKVNGESIYGTDSSPFEFLEWGRCTQKTTNIGTRLYLHVFQWPENNHLVVPGIYNDVQKTFLLDSQEQLKSYRDNDSIIIQLPKNVSDTGNAVIVLDIVGKPDINYPPNIFADNPIFIDSISVTLGTDRENLEIKYTLDSTEPSITSNSFQKDIFIDETTIIKARSFRADRSVSITAKTKYVKVKPHRSLPVKNLLSGILYSYYEGSYDSLPNFKNLTPITTGISTVGFNISKRNIDENFCFSFKGLIKIPKSDVYTFFTDSDDGSSLYIGDELVVDNDGLHSMKEKEGYIALDEGYHKIRVEFFEKSGGNELIVYYKSSTIEKQIIPSNILFYLNK